MQSGASTTAGQTSRSIFWTLFAAIQNVGMGVLAISRRLTSTLENCQEGMAKIAKDLKNPSHK